jgi:hypothetical protein
LAASDLSVQLVGWAPTDQYEQIAKWGRF